ncbi:hypothetical protein HZS_6778 [Henneguya salminicola]|nr:hypothetical protein HZS_6778 [Henneguya salminicola]
MNDGVRSNAGTNAIAERYTSTGEKEQSIPLCLLTLRKYPQFCNFSCQVKMQLYYEACRLCFKN